MEESRCDVILTNPCGATGLIVRDSLERLGLKVSVMEGPSAVKDTPGYLRELRRRLSETGASAVLPVFFPEILAERRSEFPGIDIPLDDATKIRQLDSKRSALELAAELGIPQPRRFDSPEQIGSYPVVLKRSSGQGGDSVYFPRNGRALRNILKTASDAVVTEYIDGWNVSVDALRWGEFFFAAPYRILAPLGKGVSTLRESMLAPDLVRRVRMILDRVDFNGVCGVDFRVSKQTGEALFLECNPRFSGGLESAVASGFDIPSLYWRLAHGETINPDEIEFHPGILTGCQVSPSTE